MGAFLAAEPRRVGDRLVVLVGEMAAEELGEDVAGGALEPDIEEIREFGIHDIVVIGRVHDHGVDAAVCDMVQAVAGLAGNRDPRRLPGFEQSLPFGAGQRDELADAFGGLGSGPFVAESRDQGRHLRIGPHEREIVPVENGPDPVDGIAPASGAVVVVENGVERQREIPICRLADIAQRARFPVGLEHLPEDLDARAVAEKLARREQVAPQGHAVALRLGRFVAVGDTFARHDVERLPFGQFLRKPLRDLGAVVVFGPGRAVAPRPLLAGLAGLRLDEHPFLEDDSEQLLAHTARLGLRLDFVAVDHPPAIGPRAGPRAALRRPRRLLGRGLDDLERADAAPGTRPGTGRGFQPDAGSIRRQPPVRRQRNQTLAIRTRDSARPEIIRGYGVRLGFRREIRRQAFLSHVDEPPGQMRVFGFERAAVSGRPFHGCAHNQRRHRIEVVRKGFETEPRCFERNTPSPGGRIENLEIGQRFVRRGREPSPVIPVGNVAERPRIAVSLALEAFPPTTRSVDSPPRRHWIPVNPEHVQKPLPVRVRRQQRGQHRRPRRHQRPPRPPDVQPVRRRKRRHRRPLPHALDPQRRNRQPPLDQAGIGHPTVPAPPPSRRTKRQFPLLSASPAPSGRPGRPPRLPAPPAARARAPIPAPS